MKFSKTPISSFPPPSLPSEAYSIHFDVIDRLQSRSLETLAHEREKRGKIREIDFVLQRSPFLKVCTHVLTCIYMAFFYFFLFLLNLVQLP